MCVCSSKARDRACQNYIQEVLQTQLKSTRPGSQRVGRERVQRLQRFKDLEFARKGNLSTEDATSPAVSITASFGNEEEVLNFPNISPVPISPITQQSGLLRDEPSSSNDLGSGGMITQVSGAPPFQGNDLEITEICPFVFCLDDTGKGLNPDSGASDRLDDENCTTELINLLPSTPLGIDESSEKRTEALEPNTCPITIKPKQDFNFDFDFDFCPGFEKPSARGDAVLHPPSHTEYSDLQGLSHDIWTPVLGDKPNGNTHYEQQLPHGD